MLVTYVLKYWVLKYKYVWLYNWVQFSISTCSCLLLDLWIAIERYYVNFCWDFGFVILVILVYLSNIYPNFTLFHCIPYSFLLLPPSQILSFYLIFAYVPRTRACVCLQEGLVFTCRMGLCLRFLSDVRLKLRI